MWWLLSREVMRLKGSISREIPWEVMPDLFFYREPEEVSVGIKVLNSGMLCLVYVIKHSFAVRGMVRIIWIAKHNV